jgi:hypothetical protein
MPLLKTTNRAEYLCQLDTQWKHYSIRISDSRGNETKKVLTIRTPGKEHPADTIAQINSPISDKSLKNEGFEKRNMKQGKRSPFIRAKTFPKRWWPSCLWEFPLLHPSLFGFLKTKSQPN